MKSGIYLLTNVTNGKVYVGSSKSLASRRYMHFWALRLGSHVNPHLQNAFNQCGQAAFHFSVLEYCEVADLLEREDWWMTLLRARERAYGYNLSGAQRRDPLPESIAKTAAFNRGKPRSAETKAKIGAANRGRKMSAACCAQCRARAVAAPNAGRFLPGHRQSAEVRAGFSARMKGKPAPNKGKKHTEAARAKMSLAQQARYRREKEAKGLS